VADVARADARDHRPGVLLRALDPGPERVLVDVVVSLEPGHPVLARLGPEGLARALDGWREIVDSDEPGTYEWLRARARTAK
jgi:hypothetical protein